MLPPQLLALRPSPLHSSRVRFPRPAEQSEWPTRLLPGTPQLTRFLAQRAFTLRRLTFLSISVPLIQYEYVQPQQPLLSNALPIPISLFPTQPILQRRGLLLRVFISLIQLLRRLGAPLPLFYAKAAFLLLILEFFLPQQLLAPILIFPLLTLQSTQVQWHLGVQFPLLLV